MDDTDRKLMLLICENPRMHYREIARRLGISRQAAHHRMKSLARTHAFKDIRPIISINYIRGVPAAVWGRSATGSIEETLERLGESEFVGRVVVAGGNYLYVLGFLRDTSELDGFVEFVKKAAEMPEPTVGMANLNAGILPCWMDGGKPKASYKELSPLDMRIIASLNGDVRKPITEIAKSVGVSARTVRRHLEDMRSDGSLDYDQPWDLPSGEDMITLMHVSLRTGADRAEVTRRLLAKDPIHVPYLRSFSNLPSFLIGLLYSDKMNTIRSILREMGEDKDVLSVVPNLIYLERTYTTWDERTTSAPRRISNRVLRQPRSDGAREG